MLPCVVDLTWKDRGLQLPFLGPPKPTWASVPACDLANINGDRPSPLRVSGVCSPQLLCKSIHTGVSLYRIFLLRGASIYRYLYMRVLLYRGIPI